MHTQEKRSKNNRRSIRLKEYDYSLTGTYFVTVCVHDKKCLLGTVSDNGVVLSPIGEFVNRYLNQIQDRFDSAELDEFVIMPNHIHAIIVINNDNVDTMDGCTATVGAIHKLPDTQFTQIAHTGNSNQLRLIHELTIQEQRRKMLISKIMGWFKMYSANKANIILRKSVQRFWQRNYYDHIVRNENELNRIREYIINNPMKWQSDRENPDHIVCNDNDNNLIF